MPFQISALPAARFSHLFGKPDEELRRLGVVAMTADTKPGFPCRVSLRDAEPGERTLLLNFEHQGTETPFRSRHAIFVIDGAEDACIAPGETPEQMRSRVLSVRAFSAEGLMVDADIVEGVQAAPLFKRMLGDERVSYLHVHFAKPGCFAARVDRA